MQIDLTLPQAARFGRKCGRKGPWHALLSALMELANRKAELVSHSERNWASATFSGTRHEVILSFAGSEAIAAGELFVEALPEHEFAIAGQLVADAEVVAVQHIALPEPRLEVTAELLLLEDDG